MWVFALTICAQTLAQGAQGFVHPSSEAEGYEWPTDPQVREKLEAWRDLKFGVLLHWGLYSLPGIVESWNLCSEDVDWIPRPDSLSYDAYKQWYFALKEQFCPRKFDPQAWARLFRESGSRYAVFTTKHHDGFCLFDTQATDFSVRTTPFATDARMDIARHVFSALREEGLMVGAYYSKPDWHCPYYWNPYFATPNRRENYRRDRHADWWDNYIKFTQRQLHELLYNYGPLDLLWLDGGWVSGQEIGLDSLLASARATSQKGLIAVDRTIRGRNENYLTPERGIPAEQLSVPWESCIPLGNDWGWTPNAPYKSPRKVVNTLIEVVAKGGSLLLGVGPTAEGEIEPATATRLKAVGQWLRQNGAAIYATRTLPCYRDGNLWFTASKDGVTAYALYALPEDDKVPLEIAWDGNEPDGPVRLLATGQRLRHTTTDGHTTVRLPRNLPADSFVLTYKLKKQ